MYDNNSPEDKKESDAQQKSDYSSFARKYGFSAPIEENRTAFRKTYGHKTDTERADAYCGKDACRSRRIRRSGARQITRTDTISDRIGTIIVVMICSVITIMLIVSDISQIKANAEFHSIASEADYVSATVVSSYPVSIGKRPDRMAKFGYTVNGIYYTSKEILADHSYTVGKLVHGYVMKNDPADFRIQTMATGSYMHTSLVVSAVCIPIMALICVLKIYLHRKFISRYLSQE